MSGFYLHIPFCQRKCDYCDFYSLPLENDIELQRYVELLLREIDLLAKRWAMRGPLETVFFGGGTPSLLSAEQVDSILCQLDARFGIASRCEISLEANPGTVTAEKLRGYCRVGVNRLSLGVQTLNDVQLRLLGRIHSAAEAKQAVAMARQAGFTNLNLDLIFALPEQTLPQLEQDVAELLKLQPEHLSLYGLSFEPRTPLAKRQSLGQLTEPDEQFYVDSYLLIDRLLTAAGFEHYEISNFARPGFRCRHNQAYWRRQTCLAAGCGAHSFFSNGWGERWMVDTSLPNYCERLEHLELPMERLEDFDRQTAMAETVYLALRMVDGLSRTDFQRQFGVYPEAAFPTAFRRHGERLTLQDDRWCFDLQGWLLYDHLISDFL
ncbi:radical SAM family heme chaperone HemW [Malonomonas rubra]|uniref:radical SAM family heme chaperone HemW n=1 Tax=Malonomonas rubra TaxID=57040 RepID=UPI0026ED8358|nr:radical SAM family heme chaperone HemW [Malonomonas rubra]